MTDFEKWNGRRPASGRVASVLGFLITLHGALPAAALDLNGFLPNRGHGDVASSFTSEGYDHFYRSRRLVSNPGVGDVETRSLSLWLTWGLGDDLAVVGNVAFVDATSDGTGGFADQAIQDLELVVKYRFTSRRWGSARHSWLGAAGVRTPMSDYPANLPVDVGDGTTDGLFRLIYHLEAGRFYLSQQVGFDLRGGDAPNGYPLYTEVGYTTGRVTWTGVFCKLMADGGTEIGDPGFTFPSNREEFERAGFKVYARLKKGLGISLFAFTTLDGRNTGDIQGISFGTSFRI